MKPAAFEYHRPRTIDEALALLSEVGEDGKILAKVSAEVAGNISPVMDNASESYRRSLAKVLTRRARAEAWERASREN